MNKKFLIVILFCSCFLVKNFFCVDLEEKQKVYFEGKDFSVSYGKSKCFLFCLDENEISAKLAKTIGYDLEFTDVFKVFLKKSDRVFSKEEHFRLFEKEEVDYSIYIKTLENSKKDYCRIQFCLKNNYSNLSEIDEVFEGPLKDLVWLGHKIASKVAEILTGRPGIFMKELVYCKFVSAWHKVIIRSDYAGNGSHEIVSGKGINSVPCWHPLLNVLFYTKLTPSKSMLLAFDLKTSRHKIVADFEGLNMQPSVSEDGKKVVLCLATTGNTELFLFDKDDSFRLKKRAFKQLTRNNGNNVAPIFLSNGDVVFCSDFETSGPQIYYLNMRTNKSKRLTKGAYCAGPSYCKCLNSIVYTKVVNGVFQLFTLKLKDIDGEVKEEQLTFGAGDKQDPYWAENGDYIYYSYRCPDSKREKRTMQIAVLNIASKNTHLLTSGEQPKSFPRLSFVDKKWD